MFAEFLAALLLVLQWPAIGFLLLGVVIGIWLGAVPGLGGIIGLVLLLPFTYGMETVSAFALLLGMYAVTATSDTIASVMLGIPGTAASQATILDGHPLAQQGQAARAFGAAFTVSAFGGVIGAFALATALPLVKPIILSFTSPELFMLGVLGLALVGSLSGGSVTKGLAVAALGLLVSTIGYAQTISIPRYYFGLDYLLNGLPLIPVVLGLFGIPEVMELATRNLSIARVPKSEAKGVTIFDGIRDAVRHRWLAVRCSLIGTYIGILPGLGGSIVDWIAYGHAVQSAKDRSRFGQGDIRGVIAPEAANNAAVGGTLIPTVAFGIPGSLGAAILLGALVLQGLKPGPEMLTAKLQITFSMVWSIVLANIIVTAFLLMWARQVAKVAFLPGHLIVPAVVVFVFMGAWLAGATLGDWITCLVFGVVGYFMKRGGWPRPPLVLALVLGGIMENALVISVRAHGATDWMWRPIVLILFAIVVITVYLSATGIIKAKRGENAPRLGEGREHNPLVSLPFAGLLLVVFVAALIASLPWPFAVRQFPLTFAIAGALFAAWALFYDAREARRAVATAGGFGLATREASARAVLSDSVALLAYLAAMIAAAVLIGQKLALPLFVALYVLRWGRYQWNAALVYAAFAWLLLVLLYDRVMRILWHPPLAEPLMLQLLPTGFPAWLVL